MTLAFVALPIALGIAGAVAITIILLDERERANARRAARAHKAAPSGTRRKAARSDEGSTSSVSHGQRRWTYEIRKRASDGSGRDDPDEENRLLLRPIVTERVPQHVLANPSDGELSSPDLARRSPARVDTQLVPIDEDNVSSTPPELISTCPSPLLLDSPPLVPTDAQWTPSRLATPLASGSAETSPTLHVPTPNLDDAHVNDELESRKKTTTTSAISSSVSSPVLVDGALPLAGSPSFSDDLETFYPSGGASEAWDRASETRSVVDSASPFMEDGGWYELSDAEGNDDEATGTDGGFGSDAGGRGGTRRNASVVKACEGVERGVGLGLTRL